MFNIFGVISSTMILISILVLQVTANPTQSIQASWKNESFSSLINDLEIIDKEIDNQVEKQLVFEDLRQRLFSSQVTWSGLILLHVIILGKEV